MLIDENDIPWETSNINLIYIHQLHQNIDCAETLTTLVDTAPKGQLVNCIFQSAIRRFGGDTLVLVMSDILGEGRGVGGGDTLAGKGVTPWL